MIYPSTQKGPLKVSGYHDPDSIRPIEIGLRPETWQTATVYKYIDGETFDIVYPTTYKGYAYYCINTGKSGATEPTWNLGHLTVTTEYESGQESGLAWKAVSDPYMPPTVGIGSVTFSATNGVTLSNTSYTTTLAFFTIDAIDSAAAARTLKSFDVLLRVEFDNGQSDDFTLRYKIAER